MKNRTYITQLTKEDMRELEQVTNLRPGFCIRIDRMEGEIKISIDEAALALAINGFVRNGGTNTTAANCTAVSFNPPS